CPHGTRGPGAARVARDVDPLTLVWCACREGATPRREEHRRLHPALAVTRCSREGLATPRATAVGARVQERRTPRTYTAGKAAPRRGERRGTLVAPEREGPRGRCARHRRCGHDRPPCSA